MEPMLTLRAERCSTACGDEQNLKAREAMKTTMHNRTSNAQSLFQTICKSAKALPARWFLALALPAAVFFGGSGLVAPALAAPAASVPAIAQTPPMGWNDWAHYECHFNAQTILDNAKALVKTGLAARGYNTVTIDDCWMQKTRDAKGDLQADPVRFPQGVAAVARAVHGMGLKFGIYEDSGYLTCGGFAGSGTVNGGGKDYFLQDAKLFASWGVDYLKLDGCNLYVPKGGSMNAVYRKAYAAESAALREVHRPMVFSESAPAYFQGTPDWYNVLSWVRGYGQLWREGSDIATYNPKKPDRSRFMSVLWNYSYNLELARFQTPNNWNDADFIIGGDPGMTLPESRSQMTLWSMMSAPLILSDDLAKLSPEAIAIVGNKSVLAIDQDPLGRAATLVQRGPAMDLLLKPLAHGEYAVAVLNRSASSQHVTLRPTELGFSAGCSFDAQNVWQGGSPKSATTLTADIASHDSILWRLHPTPSCGAPTRTGTVTLIVNTEDLPIDKYTRCMASNGKVGQCMGTAAESWTYTPAGELKSGGQCLSTTGGKISMAACNPGESSEHWKYTLSGNLIGAKGKCLGADTGSSVALQTCGYNLPNQVWSVPN
jgi:alpha-galactosidase